MARCLCRFHQFGGLAEVGILSRCCYLATSFTSFNALPSVSGRPCGFLYRQRLTGQLRFIGLHNAVEQPNVFLTSSSLEPCSCTLALLTGLGRKSCRSH